MARLRTSPRPLFPRGPGVGFRAALLVLISFGLFFADQRGSPALEQLRGVLTWVLRPVQFFAGAPIGMSSAVSDLSSYGSILAENRRLKEEQLKQQARLLKFAALEAENRRIRQLLASSSALEEKVLIAEIIATSQQPYGDQITLNKGTRDGVYVGQALVDAYGVMGQVIRVHPSTATAMLITDPGHGVPVEVNRTGLQTIARGGGDGRVLSLPFLPGNADLKVGDLLVSSALGGRFPAGYPVGEVFDVRRTNGEHFMQASAYPSARLNQGRQALLVWSERPVTESSTEPAAPAGAAAEAPTPTKPVAPDTSPAGANAPPAAAPVEPKPAAKPAAKPATVAAPPPAAAPESAPALPPRKPASEASATPAPARPVAGNGPAPETPRPLPPSTVENPASPPEATP